MCYDLLRFLPCFGDLCWVEPDAYGIIVFPSIISYPSKDQAGCRPKGAPPKRGDEPKGLCCTARVQWWWYRTVVVDCCVLVVVFRGGGGSCGCYSRGSCRSTCCAVAMPLSHRGGASWHCHTVPFGTTTMGRYACHKPWSIQRLVDCAQGIQRCLRRGHSWGTVHSAMTDALRESSLRRGQLGTAHSACYYGALESRSVPSHGGWSGILPRWR